MSDGLWGGRQSGSPAGLRDADCRVLACGDDSPWTCTRGGRGTRRKGRVSPRCPHSRRRNCGRSSSLEQSSPRQLACDLQTGWLYFQTRCGHPRQRARRTSQHRHGWHVAGLARARIPLGASSRRCTYLGDDVSRIHSGDAALHGKAQVRASEQPTTHNAVHHLRELYKNDYTHRLLIVAGARIHVYAVIPAGRQDVGRIYLRSCAIL
eukprot:scaffold104647_cov28-Tisochrysis_lutea.AAC.3